MKKLLFIALSAMFCVSVNAQNEDGVAVENTATSVSSASSQLEEQLNELAALIEAYREMSLKVDSAAADTTAAKGYVPIRGKSKFMRRNFFYQTLDISTSLATDNDPDLPEQTSNGQDIDENQLNSPTSFALNFGCSWTFVPGHEEGDMLKLNPLGFAYSCGVMAMFSKQDKYGTVCSFLLKGGIETGNGHAMGVGADIMGGYGKSTGDTYKIVYEEHDADRLATPYTEWCWQYGAQIWFRNNLLSTAVKNSEMLIYARFVRSVNPHSTSTYTSDTLSYDDFWKGENWSFGVTFRHRF